MNDVISVIVPIYNADQYLARCITSIESQIDVKTEVLLIDDGSTDGSLKLCYELEKRYSNIRVFHKENGGAASARNIGLDHVRGSFVAFVDADDYIDAEMYSIMQKRLIEQKAQIVCCGKTRHLKNGHIMTDMELNEPCTFEKKEALQHFFAQDGLEESICDKLFSAEILKNIRFREGSICEDILFAYDVLCFAQKVTHVGKYAFYHYCSDNANSASNSAFCKKSRAVLDYPREILLDIKNKDRSLYKWAQRYYLLRLLDVFVGLRVDGSRCEKDLKKSVEEEFYKNIIPLLRNRYIPFKKKEAAVVAALHAEAIVAWINGVMK